MVGVGGTILTSQTGQRWSAPGGIPDSGLRAIATRPRLIVAGSGGTLLSSPDGLVWTAQHSGTRRQPLGRYAAGIDAVGERSGRDGTRQQRRAELDGRPDSPTHAAGRERAELTMIGEKRVLKGAKSYFRYQPKDWSVLGRRRAFSGLWRCRRSTRRYSRAAVVLVSSAAILSGLAAPAGAQSWAHQTGVSSLPSIVVQTLAPATAPESRLTGPKSAGRRVSLRAANGTTRQGWSMTNRGAEPETRVINQRTGLCLDVRNDSQAAGADIVTDVCRKKSVSEEWLQERVKGGDWRLVDERTHQALFAQPARSTATQGPNDDRAGADWKERLAAVGSYTLRSSTVSVPVSPFKRPTFHGLCGDGYHVTGTYMKLSGGGWLFDPTFKVYGKHIYAPHFSGADPTGTTDQFGRPFYRGLKVTLGNHSLINSHDGYFTWICDPN